MQQLSDVVEVFIGRDNTVAVSTSECLVYPTTEEVIAFIKELRTAANISLDELE